MGIIRARRQSTATAAALLTVLGLAAAGCAGGGRNPAHAEPGGPGAAATDEAKQASGTVAEMADTVRAWKLDCSVSDPLAWQLAYVNDALAQGNRIGAEALLAAWTANARKLTRNGVLSPVEGARYESLAARAKDQIPATGRVNPFTPPRGPLVAARQTCVGVAGSQSSNELLDAFHTFVPYALSTIPYVGWALAGLYAIIWPSWTKDTTNWDAFQAEIAKAVQKQTKTFLNNTIVALKNASWRYLDILNGDESPENLKVAGGYWQGLQKDFDRFFPYFKSVNPDTGKAEPDAYLVLPEFSQYMTLDLSNLRDGILNGTKLGLPPTVINSYKKDFGIGGNNPAYPQGTIIKESQKWVDEQYSAGLKTTSALPLEKICTEWVDVSGGIGPPAKKCQYEEIDKYNAVNNYTMVMIQSVQDQAFNWPYFDPARCQPDGSCPAPPPNTRVIFSPAYGSGWKSMQMSGLGNQAGPIKPSNAPREPITYLGISIDCGKSDCPAGGGGIVGNDLWVRGWHFSLGESENAISYGMGSRWLGAAVFTGSPPAGSHALVRAYGVAGKTRSNPIVSRLGFTRANEQSIETGNNTQKQNFSVSFPGEIVADVYSAGNFPTSAYADGKKWQAPSSIVVGFRYADSF